MLLLLTMPVKLAVILAVLVLCVKCEETCDYLKNIEMQVLIGATTDTVNTIVNGCIRESAFDKKNITAIYIYESLPYLGKDAVSDMPNLQTFSAFNKDLNELEPGTFRNVPELRIVSLRLGNLKEVLRDTFDVIPKLEYITLSNHKIDYIEDQAFANLPLLKEVKFQYNALVFWNREWFTNTTQLEDLSFASNKIKSIPRNAFSGLKNINAIDFSSNEITVIHRNAFKGVRKLTYLGLAHNRLTTLKEDLFPNSLQIVGLYIQANYLTFLPNEVLRKISVKRVALYGNPWKCPCLDRINYWLYETNGTALQSDLCEKTHIPICMYPRSFSRTCIENVDHQLIVNFRDSLKNLTDLYESCARLD